jgi:hypothetical protein
MKNGKSVGEIIAGQSREYWVNAAKQFIWPINFTDLQILVPEKDLELVETNLMVAHFRSHGWHIQSVIGEVDTQPVFDPKMNLPARRYHEIASRSEFMAGDCFRVLSSECELRCERVEKKIQLSYTNRPGKHDLLVSEEQLKKAISFGLWIRI